MRMSNAFDRFCHIVDVSMPCNVLLSVKMVVGGYGWPSSVSTVLIGTATLAL